jgi:hypothetical protein
MVLSGRLTLNRLVATLLYHRKQSKHRSLAIETDRAYAGGRSSVRVRAWALLLGTTVCAASRR